MPVQATKGAASAQGFGQISGGSGEKVYIEDVFSTWLYTGNGSSQNIVNGIDLAGKGGMAWFAMRNYSNYNHAIVDTARDTKYTLYSNTTAAQVQWDSVTPLSNGFSVNNASSGNVNQSGGDFVSWTFRKQPKFFDVVTFTAAYSQFVTVNHNIGSTPGFIIYKNITTNGDWRCWHRTFAENDVIVLNTTAAKQANIGYISAQNSTSATFYTTYSNTDQYVAYFFAHNAGGFGLSGTDNVISCGSFTLSAGVASVNLGWEPQWLLVKRTDSTSNWVIADNMRGMPVATNLYPKGLYADNSNAESDAAAPRPNATGFYTLSGDYGTGNNGTYIYIAIRRGPMKVPTSGGGVFAPVIFNGYSSNPTILTTNINADTYITRSRSGYASYGWFWGDKLRGNTLALHSELTNAEDSNQFGKHSLINTGIRYVDYGLDGFSTQSPYGGPYAVYSFTRAPGFFDVVCYTGTGSARTVNHNLGVAPELMIVKNRSAVTNWFVYSSALGATKYLNLNQTSASATATAAWNDTAPTTSVFTVGTSGSTNGNTENHVAYLFATCPGVSKVGSYTGNGSSQTINCGFTGGARFVLIKRTDSTGDWYVWDSARGIVAANDPRLSLNSTAAEVTTDDSVDTDSTGFIVNQLSATNLNFPGGGTWTSRTSGHGTSAIFAATSGNGVYVIGGDLNKISTSTDGTSWTARTSPFPAFTVVQALAFGSSVFVAGTADGRLASSPDGVTWTTRTSPFSATIRGIASSGSLFVAVGNSGAIATSPDGITWTSRTSGTANTLRAVNFGNNTFIAVGDNGTVITSTDGITWTASSSGTTNTLRATAFGSGRYVIAGDSGLIRVSTDLVTWTTVTSGFGSNTIFGMSYINGQFVAVGGANNISRSLTGASGTWAADSPPSTSVLYTVAYLNGRYIVVGDNGGLWSSDRGTYIYLAIA